ncbi:unnamed protein product [Linum tenue]|uniref:protein-disulfide reductase n=2 Tax=Linum tenue TaxID=586396 RepID=A0AAV0N418_9ROSI|nr:unnamed protein product [Linum tenue]
MTHAVSSQKRISNVAWLLLLQKGRRETKQGNQCSVTIPVQSSFSSPEPGHSKMGSDDGYSQRLSSLLSAKDRDFLIRRNVDQVKIGSLAGKPLGLYFSASGCKPSQGFTPLLLQAYEDLTKSKSDFEVVFVSSDEDEESFDHYFSKMPWLAVPFSDSDTRAGLRELFKVKATPHLVILDKQGKVSCHGGVKIVTKYGARGYPFTEEKLKFLSEEQENAKKNQTLTSLLASPTRDYLISNDGTETAVHELEGKMVLLYITSHDVPSCAEFTPKLVDFYKKVKENGEGNFEVVLVSFDSTEEKYRTWFETMPWLAVPFQDKTCGKLLDYFQVRSAPTVIVIGRDGKTMNPNVAELIEEFGIVAYPFSPEKIAEFAEVKKARNAEVSQTLESILVHGDKDFLFDNSGSKASLLIYSSSSRLL